MTSDVVPDRCPWCSAALPPRRTSASCPSCGAALRQADDEIPGLTRVDPAVLARAQRPAPRSRLLGWLAGGGSDIGAPMADTATAVATADAGLVDDRVSLEPPSEAVRREIRRLELEARQAELAAERREIDEPSAFAEDEADDAGSGPDGGAAASEDPTGGQAPGPGARASEAPERTRGKPRRRKTSAS